MSKSAQGRSGSLQLELKRKVREAGAASASLDWLKLSCSCVLPGNLAIFPQNHLVFSMYKMNWAVQIAIDQKKVTHSTL